MLLPAIPQLKTALKGKRFKGLDITKENTTRHLKSILQDSFKKPSNNGGTAGVSSVQHQKKTTSKIINYLYV
jgi:hypothetical protein